MFVEPDVKKARELARRWMRGLRKNSTRESWRHPEDMVALLSETPGPWTHDAYKRRVFETVIWLHDLLEEGVMENGLTPTADDLRNVGFSSEIVDMVQVLSRDKKNEAKEAYLQRVSQARDDVLVLKAIDRVTNLEEGGVTRGPGEWLDGYIRQTREFIIPFVKRLPAPHGPRLLERLEEVIARYESKT